MRNCLLKLCLDTCELPETLGGAQVLVVGAPDRSEEDRDTGPGPEALGAKQMAWWTICSVLTLLGSQEGDGLFQSCPCRQQQVLLLETCLYCCCCC